MSEEARVASDPIRLNLVIVVSSPLTDNIYERIGATLLAEQFEVTVLDCFDWLMTFDVRPQFIQSTAGNIRVIRDKVALRRTLAELRPVALIDFVGRGKFTRMLEDECTSCGALYVTHHLVPTPAKITRSNLAKSLATHPVTTVQKVARHLMARFAGDALRAPDVALLAGTRSENPWVLSAGKVIHTATPGYFELQGSIAEFSKRSIALSLPPQGYALFIDDCLPLSFDFVVGGHKPVIEAAPYFRAMNAFFDRVERILGLPIVVAAHPNGKQFDAYGDLFGGRRTIFDSTAVLSVGAHLAMTHYSSAVTFPVLLEKPVTLLGFKELRQSAQGRVVEVIADTLKRSIVDISAELDDAKINAILSADVDRFAYREYRKAYISSTDTPGRHAFDALARYLAARGADMDTKRS